MGIFIKIMTWEDTFLTNVFILLRLKWCVLYIWAGCTLVWCGGCLWTFLCQRFRYCWTYQTDQFRWFWIFLLVQNRLDICGEKVWLFAKNTWVFAINEVICGCWNILEFTNRLLQFLANSAPLNVTEMWLKKTKFCFICMYFLIFRTKDWLLHIYFT